MDRLGCRKAAFFAVSNAAVQGETELLRRRAGILSKLSVKQVALPNLVKKGKPGLDVEYFQRIVKLVNEQENKAGLWSGMRIQCFYGCKRLPALAEPLKSQSLE